VFKTLRIVENRGYNLTLEHLSNNLMGGNVNIADIEREIKNFENIDFDGIFVATSGNLKTAKCLERLQSNDKLQSYYLKIAQDFVSNYITLCPWVKCVMLAGSMASDGLGDGDDIDLNIVVQDRTKYSSWLFGILLSIKYSITFRKGFRVKWFNLIGKVICISVIWEVHEVLPFRRRDDQVAYELLLNSKVLYNRDFFKQILEQNRWLTQWFPQIFEKFNHIRNDIVVSSVKRRNRIVPRFIEVLSLALVFIIYYTVRASVFWHDGLKNQMDADKKIKCPYGVLDIPKRKKNVY
jgi:hypothetical protein